MGSSAKNFVRVSLALSLWLYGCNFARPPAVAAQESTEEAIFDQALKEAAQELAQQKKEHARAEKRSQSKYRSTRQFESLLAKAREQHVKIKEWQKGNLKQWKVYATKVHNKRHLLVASTISR